ncbi:MAG: hypothetical protein ACE366_11000 [Bradymonadia bacterium]
MFVPFALIVSLLYAPQHPFPAPQVTESPAVGGRWITVTIAAPPSTGPEYKSEVYFTAEPVMVVSPKAYTALNEANIADSGLAMDLNGDGDRTDVLPTTCEGRDVKVGESTFTPLFKASYMQYTEKSVGRIGKNGAQVVQYTPCGPYLAMGFSPPGHDLKLQKLTGPMLQISVAQPQPGPRGLPTLRTSSWTLDGKPIAPLMTQVKSFEPGEKQTPTWVHVHWAVMSIPVGGQHVVKFKVEGPGKGMVAAGVNLAPAPGRRWRGPMGTHQLK